VLTALASPVGFQVEYCAKLRPAVTAMPTAPEAPDNEITLLLAAYRSGEAGAEARLLEIVYQELREIARRHMRREGPGHTLQPTALVSEAYLRLFGNKIDWQNRAQFFGVAARTMRRILVDHARNRRTRKRSGGKRIELDQVALVAPEQVENVLALDEALERLATRDARQAKLVELRFFAGMTIEEAAVSLGVSSRTAKRDWDFAQAWLFREMDSGQSRILDI
jgi:RNA polymerase sigma-70 factor (ECF subfamily)